jgi:SM-20-related protein
LKVEAAIDGLVANGWAVIDDFFSADLCGTLRQTVIDDEKSGHFKKAGIGRGTTFQVDSSLRADYIRWIDEYEDNAGVNQAREQIEGLRIQVNRALYLGLNDFEGHLTHYPAGPGYTKHVDRFQDNNARTLSFVSYLNENWTSNDGGSLKIYGRDASGELVADILPVSGRAVIFLSDGIYHEVSPNLRSRYSLTGWYRR